MAFAESLFSLIASNSEQHDKCVDISIILELFEKMKRSNLGLANDSLFSIKTKHKFFEPSTAVVLAAETFSKEKLSREHSVLSMAGQLPLRHKSDFVAVSFSSLKPTSWQSLITTHNIQKHYNKYVFLIHNVF